LIIYLDTSALLKQYIQETGSDEVIKLLGGASSNGTNLLTYAEMASAITRSVRMGLISEDEAQTTWGDFLIDWELLVRLEVSWQITKRAAALAWEYGLRGYDAMHFASAMGWQDAIDMPVTLATYDRTLWTAAQKSGMEVWPEKLII
jgi:predicted nucleic acid-binding protein